MKNLADGKILPESVENHFLENAPNIPPDTKFNILGLASALDRIESKWRPTARELIEILRPMQRTKLLKLLAAGGAYASAITIPKDYSAPRILMFSSAVNCIGEAPQTELWAAISSAAHRISVGELGDCDDIKLIIEAAVQRAKFDRVNEMLRNEFTAGLKKVGFPKDAIEKLVSGIVKAAASARHSALVGRVQWHTYEGTTRIDISDPFHEFAQDGSYYYGEADLKAEDNAAMLGSAYSILSRVRPDLF